MAEDGDAAPQILDLPIGLDAAGTRAEFDSLGEVDVPAGRYWGAQTQRSLEHFSVGQDKMPAEVYHAYGYVKKAAALVNARSGRLPEWMGQLIARVCDEIISRRAGPRVPAARVPDRVGHPLQHERQRGHRQPVHPAGRRHARLAAAGAPQRSRQHGPVEQRHVPGRDAHRRLHHGHRADHPGACARCGTPSRANAEKWAGVVKIGRTHLEDATPLTVGQEWSGYAGALDDAIAEVEHVTHGLLQLAMGGTAVGTGLNAPEGFGEEVAAEIAAMTGAPYVTAVNKFTAQATLDRMVRAHGGLKAAAVTLFKIANDLRWLGSGPRTGLGELILPSNEPGSSIMPGKVNPTQAEAMLMVAIQVMASDVAVTMGGAEGNFELNAFRPIVISNYLHSALIMADMCDHLREFMIEGTQVNEGKLTENIERSVMMVTALSPVIGYDQASVIAHYAIDHDLTLRQAALANGVSDDLFDRVVDPVALTRGGTARPRGHAAGSREILEGVWLLRWRFRSPLGPQAELQAHR